MLEVARRVVADPVRGLELVVSFVAAGDGMTTGTQVAADRPRVRADVVVALDTVGTGSPFVALTADDVAVEREIGLLELIAERSGASVEAVVDVSGLHGAFWLAGVPSLTLTRPGNERVGLPADTVADLDAMRSSKTSISWKRSYGISRWLPIHDACDTTSGIRRRYPLRR